MSNTTPPKADVAQDNTNIPAEQGDTLVAATPDATDAQMPDSASSEERVDNDAPLIYPEEAADSTTSSTIDSTSRELAAEDLGADPLVFTPDAENTPATPERLVLGATAPATNPSTGKAPRYTTQQSLADTSPSSPTLPAGEHGFASRLFSFLTMFPLLPLTLLVVAQCFFLLDYRALWYSDEVRHASVFQSMLQQGEWLVMHLNGVPYPDKPPLYFWFVAGIEQLLRLTKIALPSPESLFFLAAAVSGVLYIWASYGLARIVGGANKATAFAAGLILFSTFYFSGLLHYARMDLLFATLILLSHIAFFKALSAPKGTVSFCLAFLFAAAAVLTKGPLGIAFPLITALLYSVWIRKPGRFFRLSILPGCFLFLVLVGGWIAAAWFMGYTDFVANILQQQVLARTLDTWHHAAPWWYYLAALPLGWMPWTLVFPLALFFIPWKTIFTKKSAQDTTAQATPAQGMAYIWIMLLSGIALLSVVSIKILIYALPLFAPLALITAALFFRFSSRASVLFSRVMNVFLLLLACAFVALPFVTPELLELKDFTPSGTFILAGVCFLAASLNAFGVKNTRPEPILLVMALFITVLVQPLGLITAPALDSFMSPKAQALLLKQYVADGYTPISYGVYSGTYTYYAETDLMEVSDLAALEQTLVAHPKAVVALRASHWKAWQLEASYPANLLLVNTQRIVERDYILAVTQEHAVSEKQEIVSAVPDEVPPPEEVGTGGIPLAPQANNATTSGAPQELPTLPVIPAFKDANSTNLPKQLAPSNAPLNTPSAAPVDAFTVVPSVASDSALPEGMRDEENNESLAPAILLPTNSTETVPSEPDATHIQTNGTAQTIEAQPSASPEEKELLLPRVPDMPTAPGVDLPLESALPLLTPETGGSTPIVLPMPDISTRNASNNTAPDNVLALPTLMGNGTIPMQDVE